MKRAFSKEVWGRAIKRIAIATFALAALFMFNVTAVYANEVEVAAQEQGRLGRPINTEREERVRLFNFRGVRDELGFERSGSRERTERIGLPNFRETRDEIGFERSGTRERSERESRNRTRTVTESPQS